MLLVPHLRAGHKHRASEAASPPPRYSPLPTPHPVPELQGAGGGRDTWGWGHPGRSKTCNDVPAGAAGESLGLEAWVARWSSGAGKRKHRRQKGLFAWFWSLQMPGQRVSGEEGVKKTKPRSSPLPQSQERGRCRCCQLCPAPWVPLVPGACLGWDFVISIEKKKENFGLVLTLPHAHNEHGDPGRHLPL